MARPTFRRFAGGRVGQRFRRPPASTTFRRFTARWSDRDLVACPYGPRRDETFKSHTRALRRARNGELVEDYYWGHFSPIKVASIPEAIAFAFEMGLEQMADDYRDLIPFGCHAVWNLDYIADYRRGKPQHREPEYERVLYSILERSGNA